MSAAPKMLVITTRRDLSLKLFKAKNAKALIRAEHIYYNSAPWVINRALKSNYQYVYFRDPFNASGYSEETVIRTMSKVTSKYPDAYYIDGVKDYKQIILEDKWQQYQKLSALMPPTRLLKSLINIDFDKNFVNKRISSRSNGVILSKDEFPAGDIPSNYIVQPRLDISAEYRVFMVGGKVILPVALRSSKKAGQKVKIVGTADMVDPAVAKMCKQIYRLMKYDFMGLDVVKTDDKYYLLEVNRSCQFIGFYRQTLTNLAMVLNNYILGK